MRDLAICPANHRGHAWGGDGGFDRIRSALTLRSLRRAAPPTGRLHVLELGFGRGILLSRFLREGHEVAGIDPGMLQRDLEPDLTALGDLRAESAETADLGTAEFDLIYGIHVVEHLRDPAVVFRSCFEALRPGGALYLMTPDAGSAGLRVFRDAWWNLEDPTHIRFFSQRSITGMLRAAGFERGLVRTPRWDSITLEISSLLRTVDRHPGEHGVLAEPWAKPVYAALLPAAVAARAAWPALSPSMEVVTRRPD
jgi:SAM-dependent methyltransferase